MVLIEWNLEVMAETIFFRTLCSGAAEAQTKNCTKSQKPHHLKTFSDSKSWKWIPHITQSEYNDIIKMLTSHATSSKRLTRKTSELLQRSVTATGLEKSIFLDDSLKTEVLWISTKNSAGCSSNKCQMFPYKAKLILPSFVTST